MRYGNILTPEGWRLGEIHWRYGRIVGIDGAPTVPADNEAPYVLPGFVDLHVHGGGGADTMEGGEAVATLALTHARFGTTSLLATTMTATAAEVRRVLGEIGTLIKAPPGEGARILGVHLEGPYINPGKLGAQPLHARPGEIDEIDEIDELCELAPIRLVTLAPELSGHYALIRHLSERGVRVQLGHTLGSYEQGVAAMEHGACGFTHLYNAMTGLHHRHPGMVGAALAHADFAELIPDLLHVHPGAIRVALRSIPRLYAVTDSTAAAGMPDGEYRLGEQAVTKCLGGVRLADGTLAGSTLTMDQALRNLVAIGLPLDEASARVSRHPADFLGLHDRGRLAGGCHADLVVLDRELAVEAVYVEGRRVGHGTGPDPPAGSSASSSAIPPRRRLMSSMMLSEARNAPERIAGQLTRNAEPLAELGEWLRQRDPHGVVTVARGSSDHAASYFGYLCMQSRGIPVASLPPSLTTLARAPWKLDGQLALAISQSGQSPDLIETQKALAAGGAQTLALVNTPRSPLGEVSDREIPLYAGEERSVAATKSYLATLSACAQLLGHWNGDRELLAALEALPERLHAAAEQDWSPAIEALRDADRLMVVGRGTGLAIAQEAALKFKETCAIQAEPFSGAEVKHGPMALIGPGYRVLVFAPPGPEQAGLLELAEWLKSVGARVLLAADESVAQRELTLADAGHAALQPLAVIQSFYVMAAGLAAARGSDPDQPRHLKKVTRTR